MKKIFITLTALATLCALISAYAEPKIEQKENAAKILLNIVDVNLMRTQNREGVIVLLASKGKVIYGAAALATDENKRFLNKNKDKLVSMQDVTMLFKVKDIDKSPSTEDDVPDIPARVVKVKTKEIDGTTCYFIELTTDNSGNWLATGDMSINAAALVFIAKQKPNEPISLQIWNKPLFVEKLNQKRQ